MAICKQEHYKFPCHFLNTNIFQSYLTHFLFLNYSSEQSWSVIPKSHALGRGIQYTIHCFIRLAYYTQHTSLNTLPPQCFRETAILSQSTIIYQKQQVIFVIFFFVSLISFYETHIKHCSLSQALQRERCTLYGFFILTERVPSRRHTSVVPIYPNRDNGLRLF